MPAKEDSHYLTHMPLYNQCCLVRGGESVVTKEQDRVSFCKLLEISLANTEHPRCHFRPRYGMDE